MLEADCPAGFCAVEEECGGNANAAGTLHRPSEASTTAAMNLFFIPRPFISYQGDRVGCRSL
jgi:hypothetical protein